MEYIEFSYEFVTRNPRSIMLLGVNPRQPEDEYGWIIAGEEIANSDIRPVHKVSRFVEKPDILTVSQLHHDGGQWNTMVIISKAKTFLTLFKIFTPTMYKAFWELRDVLGTSLETSIIEDMYSRLSMVNFSYSILGKNPVGLCTIKLQGVYWSDWGNATRIQSDIQRFYAAKIINYQMPLPAKQLLLLGR